jgi:hypothetical protein
MQILFGGVGGVILFSGRWEIRGFPRNFCGARGSACGGYVSSLDSFTQLAEEKKEILIDALCR